jgi:tripartite-type tricarboxylate transporter receptor subunit TctC
MMKPSRRIVLQCAGAAATACTFSRVATAQTYPIRPITLIVPFPPGGTTDVIARLIAERMRAKLGQPVIIENVGGADGSIGVGRAARARADGYTLCVGLIDTHVLNAVFYSLPYDVLRDFVSITPLAANPVILYGGQSVPASNLDELIAWMKAHPDKASAGLNALGFRLIALLFQKQTGTQFTIIPYRSAGSQREDFISGRIELLFGFPQALSLLPKGAPKPYAATSETRWSFTPEIPTFSELGLPSLVYSSWSGLFAPKGTPSEVITKLNVAAVAALSDPDVHARLGDIGIEVFPRERQTPEALASMQKTDAEKWWPLIKEFGIKAE